MLRTFISKPKECKVIQVLPTLAPPLLVEGTITKAAGDADPTVWAGALFSDSTLIGPAPPAGTLPQPVLPPLPLQPFKFSGSVSIPSTLLCADVEPLPPNYLAVWAGSGNPVVWSPAADTKTVKGVDLTMLLPSPPPRPPKQKGVKKKKKKKSAT